MNCRNCPNEASHSLVKLILFPVAERVGLLSHVRSFLKPGGQLLLTTVCRGRGSAAAVLDLWGSMTAHCGRLPAPHEMTDQLRHAGFGGVTVTNLVPGEGFYAFVGTNPARPTEQRFG